MPWYRDRSLRLVLGLCWGVFTHAAASPSVASAAARDEGIVVWVGAATESFWADAIRRNDLPDTQGESFATVPATADSFLPILRNHRVVGRSPALKDAVEACSAQPLRFEDFILRAKDALDAKAWSDARDMLRQARALWPCADIPVPPSQLADAYFLEGVAAYNAGQSMAAARAFAVALGSGAEPGDLYAQPPQLQEAYFSTAWDETWLQRSPVIFDVGAMDDLALWIDGQERAELFELPAGEHVVQVVTRQGALVASTLVVIDPEEVGPPLALPGGLFPITSREQTLKDLERDMLASSLDGAWQRALKEMAREAELPFLIVGAVERERGELVTWRATIQGVGADRIHIKGAREREIRRATFPVMAGVFTVGALSGAAGYGSSYYHLTYDLYPSQAAVDAAQTRGYVGGGIAIGCAAGLVTTGVLWAVDKRRRREDLIYGAAGGPSLALGPGPGSLGVGVGLRW